MHGATERTPVATQWLVILEVCHRAVTGKFLRQQPNKRDNVGLLHYFCPLRALPPEDNVHRHRASCVVRQIYILKIEEPGELLV